MGKRLVRRPSPAMVVAILALCLAVGGTAFAAVKLGKNAVKTKNIKNSAVTESKIAGNAVTGSKIADSAVTESKIASGAVSAGKLAGSAKSTWVETQFGGFTIARQSGGVTVTADGTGKAAVNFGIDLSGRGISVTPNLNLGSVVAEFARCVDISCGAGLTGNPNAIEVFTWASSTSTLTTSGFSAVVSP